MAFTVNPPATVRTRIADLLVQAVRPRGFFASAAGRGTTIGDGSVSVNRWSC